MNKKEIREIKKQFTINTCGITRLCGCYVDVEKNIKSQWQQSFLSLPEEEAIKYLNLIRKTLSGGLGKDIVNLAIRKKAGIEGGILRRLRDTLIEEDTVLEPYYDFVINHLDYTGQFAILTAYGSYDIPGKTKDGQELEDASEEVYEYIITCICPVNLQKPGLVYDPDKGSFTPLETARMLADPIVGVLYPAFNNRSQDTGAALCYCHNMRDGGRDYLYQLTGSRILFSAEEERAVYMGILDKVLGSHATLQEVKRVEESLQELKAKHACDQEPYMIGIEDMAMLFRNSEIDEARIAQLEEAYAIEANPDARLTLDNLGHMWAFSVEMEEGRLILDPGHAYKLEVRELEGEKVLVMPLQGNVEVNGIRIDLGEGG